MAVVSMKALLETGVHFGHRTRRWNPKMKPFIFTERNGIHIIDLQQTIQTIEDAYAMIRDTAARGGAVLFIGTKRQAQETIAQQAQRCGMPYVNQRWLGGTLTNWRTIRSRVEYMRDLEARRDAGDFERLPKKEALDLNREIEALNERIGGLKEMKRLPELLFIVDVRREETAVREANSLNIPIIAMVDTNCDPDHIDHVIPANDDAIRAIKLIVSRMADAVLEGMNMRKDTGLPIETTAAAQDYERFGAEAEEMEDEAYLGEATLAKLRGGELFPEKPAGDAETRDEVRMDEIQPATVTENGQDETLKVEQEV
jgi:small subunit ribosomal protein S2